MPLPFLAFRFGCLRVGLNLCRTAKRKWVVRYGQKTPLLISGTDNVLFTSRTTKRRTKVKADMYFVSERTSHFSCQTKRKANGYRRTEPNRYEIKAWPIGPLQYPYHSLLAWLLVIQSEPHTIAKKAAQKLIGACYGPIQLSNDRPSRTTKAHSTRSEPPRTRGRENQTTAVFDNSVYRMYPPAARIKNFPSLKTAVVWAGVLGVVQSIIWIGLTITAICAYNCVLYITDELSFGTLLKTVFFDLYFKGSCKMNPADYQNYDYGILKTVETVFDPSQVLIWDCFYLGVSVCWLIVSIVLLLCVRKDNPKLSLIAIAHWAFFVAVICCMDVASGVIFGIDYGRFQAAALTYNANTINSDPVLPMASTLMAGGVAAISMMIISFKGFILWLINVGLLFYLSMRATRIATDKDSVDTLFNPRKDSNDILTTRTPIRAYEEEKVEFQAYNNAAYMADNRSSAETIEVNEQAIVRAAHMSLDSNLMDRRFRDINAFQQYPAPNPHDSRPLRSPMQETVVVATSGFPMPDYTPQPSPSGVLRHPQY